MERVGTVCLPFLSKGIVPVILSVLLACFYSLYILVGLAENLPFLRPKV